MIFPAAHWLGRAQTLLHENQIETSSNVDPVSEICGQKTCLKCNRPYFTLGMSDLSLKCFSDGTLDRKKRKKRISTNLRPDLRVVSFYKYSPITPLFRYATNLEPDALRCKWQRLIAFDTSRLLLIYAIGTFITSPQASQNRCNTPGRNLCVEAEIIHRRVALELKQKDVITQLLILAYQILSGDKVSVPTSIYELEKIWTGTRKDDAAIVRLDFVHWACYGFLYWLSESSCLDSGCNILGREIKIESYNPTVYGINFRTGLYEVQSRAEFGTNERAQERASGLEQLLHAHQMMFDHQDSVSLPLLLEWHLTFVFSGWQTLENFLSQQSRWDPKLLPKLLESLRMVATFQANGMLQTPALLFRQNSSQTWHVIFELAWSRFMAWTAAQTGTAAEV